MHFEGSKRRIFPGIVAAALVLFGLGGQVLAANIEQQRELFTAVYETAERGDWSLVEGLSAADREALETYALWPDLRAAWLRANLRKVPAKEITDFLDTHGTLRPARQLRYRYALHLARGGQLDAFHEIYEQYYHGQELARLDCLSLQAEIEAGRDARVIGRGIDLWLVGKSQVDECDPVFEFLHEKQQLGAIEYRKRYQLAIDAREFRLARWLGKKIDQDHVDEANRWIQAQSKPDRFIARHERRLDSETYREQLVYAAERLTYKDPEAALRAWQSVESKFPFTEEQKLRTRRHVALWTARDNLPGGYAQLAGLPHAAQDDEVMRWRARTSLRDGQWQRLLVDINTMQAPERDAEEWRYWTAIAQMRSGAAVEGRAALEILSSERSYYGFLAADELGRDYAMDAATMQASDAVLSRVESDPGIVRARELFLVGLDSSGRSEWQAAIQYFSDEEKLQAAILADRWGWHSRAISTAASVGEYDDLAIRYPLPWQEQFETHANAASIDTTWAYGIARSESLFMRDVRSSAGAVGLMQLMPKTGRSVARKIKLPYAGLKTLTDPVSNIRLGTSYLGQMADRFGGHRVLATAAYNAGPHRVDDWLPAQGSEDARVWIENIPFNETREYVKRVLAAQAIFHWRMTGQVRRVSDELHRISAPEAVKLASR